MKKLSQLDEKGLLKRSKVCLMGQIASLCASVTGIGLVFASMAMDISGGCSLPQVITTLATGIGVGLLGAVGTSTCIKADEQIEAERRQRKEYEGFVPFDEEEQER